MAFFPKKRFSQVSVVKVFRPSRRSMVVTNIILCDVSSAVNLDRLSIKKNSIVLFGKKLVVEEVFVLLPGKNTQRTGGE